MSSNDLISRCHYWLDRHLFMILLTVRTLSVYYNQVWDCDEVYNYWEPLHYLLTGDTSFQTWEYSPAYSLRSYLYLFMHYVPLWPFKSILSKITLFYLLRFMFAVVTSALETYMYKSVKKLLAKSNWSNISFYYLLFTLTNIGMFLSATTFLPSTFSMYMCMMSYAALFNNSNRLAILSIGLAVLLGWPFSSILGLPVLIQIIFFKPAHIISNIWFAIKWIILFGLLITIPLVLVDSYMFGKLVIAPVNIVLYNVFPSNPNIGPDIYGKEPFSFYILNCLLNFNILFPLAIISMFFLWLDYVQNRLTHLLNEQTRNNNHLEANRKLRFSVLAMYLWMCVFFTRAHKEERFLYPIYPLMLMSGAITLNYVHLSLRSLSLNSFLKRFTFLVDLIPLVVILLHAVLSLMRGVALVKNFSASIEIYKHLNIPANKYTDPYLHSKEIINVCVSKEWYRFPSHFFIPEESNINTFRQKWRLAFLESDFKGQLPGYYNSSIPLPFSTRFVDKLFNDENKEVKQRYIDLNKCDYFIDTDDQLDSDSHIQLTYNKKKTNTKWKTLAKLPFIDSSNQLNNNFYKSFYVPYLYETKIKMTFFKLRIRVR